MPDQAAALRWVVLIDRLYDRSIPVRHSGEPLDGLFTADMLRGGYRKKYLRATVPDAGAEPRRPPAGDQPAASTSTRMSTAQSISSR